MTWLDPWGPIVGVLFEDGSSDFILTTLARAGIPTHFELTEEESYSHRTRKRAYLKRLGPIYTAFDDSTRHRVAENIAKQLTKSEATAQRLNDALRDVGWALRQGKLVRLAESRPADSVTAGREPSGSTGPLRVFLCHSSADKPDVRELQKRLRTEGIDPWLDEEKLLAGQDWEMEITKAVRASHVVVVCLSRGSITKEGFVQKEIKQALDVADEKPQGTIFLIPLKLEECEVPERLRRWQFVNLFEEKGYERLRQALQRRAIDLGLTLHPTMTEILQDFLGIRSPDS